MIPTPTLNENNTLRDDNYQEPPRIRIHLVLFPAFSITVTRTVAPEYMV